MAVNWALAGNQPDFGAVYDASFERGRENRRREGVQAAMDLMASNPQQAETDLTRYGEYGAANASRAQRQQQEEQARRQALFARATGGDIAGARAEAGASGDAELYAAFDKMEKDQQQAVVARIPALVNLLGAVKARTTGQDGPPDTSERQAIAFHLIDQMGGVLPPDQLEQMRQRVMSADWTDAGIDQQVASLRSLLPQERVTVGNTIGLWQGGQFTPTYTAPQAPQRPLVVGPNASVLDPATGQPIYRAPPAPPRPRAAGGGRGGGSSAAPAARPPWERTW